MTINILSNHEYIQKQSKRLQQEVGGGLPNGTIRLSYIPIDEDNDGSRELFKTVCEINTNIIGIVIRQTDNDSSSPDIRMNIHNLTKELITTETLTSDISSATFVSLYIDGETIHLNILINGNPYHQDYDILNNTVGTTTSTYITTGTLLVDDDTVTRNNKVWSSITGKKNNSDYDVYTQYLVGNDPV